MFVKSADRRSRPEVRLPRSSAEGSKPQITEHNGGICSRDFVHHMRTRPFELVRFHSDFMTLHPGDLISTGCPKGARIKAGDRIRARIEGVGTLGATAKQGSRMPRY